MKMSPNVTIAKNGKTLDLQGFGWWSAGDSKRPGIFRSLKTVENQGGQTHCPKV